MNDIRALVKEYGVKNVRVFAPLFRLQLSGIIPGLAFKCSDDIPVDTECEIVETRYKVSEGYKITLKALDPAFGYEHYYQSDFDAMVERNPESYRIYILNIDGYEKVS